MKSESLTRCYGPAGSTAVIIEGLLFKRLSLNFYITILAGG